jgi:hypothetical protein
MVETLDIASDTNNFNISIIQVRICGRLNYLLYVVSRGNNFFRVMLNSALCALIKHIQK